MFHFQIFVPFSSLQIIGMAVLLSLACPLSANPAKGSSSEEERKSVTDKANGKATENAQAIENIAVTARRPYYHETLTKIFPLYQYDQQNLTEPTTVNDVLVQSPLVSLNGQGGQIQNISIRGFSRWRIQTLINGVPIISDRRAGSSTGFLPPRFISNISVIPGAASTYLGSGAMGGAVNISLSEPNGHQFQAGLLNNAATQEIAYSGHNINTDWKLSYRHASNAEDANNNVLYDQFEQTALFVRHQFEKTPITEAWSLYSQNSNVGKSSSDFPEDRVTTYPQNTHWLGKVSANFGAITSNVWWHQSQLDTDTLRPEQRLNESRSRAFDYGGDMGSKVRLANWNINWQAQIQGRNGVRIDERELAFNSQAAPNQYNYSEETYSVAPLDASEFALAGVFDASRTVGAFSLAVGARFDWQRQNTTDQNAGDHSIANSNMSGFAGGSYSITPHWRASIYVSSAFRNPSLTERFYSGETPRGTVIGDAELNTEKSLNVQGVVSYANKTVTASAEAFHQSIKQYIERIAINDNLLQYVNLNRAQIDGISYSAKWAPDTSLLSLKLSGALLQGEDSTGSPISDIPPNNHRLDIVYDLGRVRAFSSLLYRASKISAADGERSLRSTLSLDVGVSWEVNENVTAKVSANNLTNQLFYVSADDRAAFARGRNLNFYLSVLL
ncbi:MAG: TonB-dependent receptor [Alteromonas sp.]|nr:TonB-dependent receptor [Alteromonas sp.]